MGLPKHVVAQQKAVESYEAKIKKEQEPVKEPEKKEPEAKEPEQAEKTPTQVKTDDKSDPRHADVEYWKNRCNVMLGKYNAETRQLNAKIQSLEKQVELLSKKPESSELISPDKKTEFGEYADLVEETISKTQQETNQKLAEQQATIDSMNAQNAANAEQTFIEKLSAQVPDWQRINASDEFNDWLDQVDPLSGHDYRTLLQEADRNQDINRVVFFFNKFGESGKQSASTDNEVSENAKDNESLSNESVLPEQRQGGNQNDPHDGYMTRQDIDTFYKDVARGKYRGREDEVDAMEQKIAQASKHGRII
ncbi:hypothetical protein [Aliikangiella coralliicola]|uniref:Uncharacterized protein n=1 Tax=Aliikangiella coralliicola TaxID=2592383 RepID=A0A545U068_9GAMM|nr:hypothetical protein [Aliikangiella coralliicola]TQV82856.1 hypothetical protein FLL46_24105 [Aliikangiella coralliicola]